MHTSRVASAAGPSKQNNYYYLDRYCYGYYSMLLTTADDTTTADCEVCALIMLAPYGDIILTSCSPVQQEKKTKRGVRPVK